MIPQAPSETEGVASTDPLVRLWRAVLTDYFVLMDRADRLDREEQPEQAQSLRREAGDRIRSFRFPRP